MVRGSRTGPNFGSLLPVISHIIQSTVEAASKPLLLLVAQLLQSAPPKTSCQALPGLKGESCKLHAI